MAAIAAYYAPKIPNYRMPLMAIESAESREMTARISLSAWDSGDTLNFIGLTAKIRKKKNGSRIVLAGTQMNGAGLHGRLIDSVENGWQV